MSLALERLAGELAGVVGAAVELERPSDPKHGDFATNVALRLAPERRTSRDREARNGGRRDGVGLVLADALQVAREVADVPRFDRLDLPDRHDHVGCGCAGEHRDESHIKDGRAGLEPSPAIPDPLGLDTGRFRFDLGDQAVDFVLSKINLHVGTLCAPTGAPARVQVRLSVPE